MSAAATGAPTSGTTIRGETFYVDAIREGLRGLVKHERLIAEGATGVGLAAVLSRRIDLKGRRVGVVLSGANIDPEVLKSVL